MEYITITHHRGRRINLQVAIDILKRNQKTDIRKKCSVTVLLEKSEGV